MRTAPTLSPEAVEAIKTFRETRRELPYTGIPRRGHELLQQHGLTYVSNAVAACAVYGFENVEEVAAYASMYRIPETYGLSPHSRYNEGFLAALLGPFLILNEFKHDIPGTPIELRDFMRGLVTNPNPAGALHSGWAEIWEEAALAIA